MLVLARKIGQRIRIKTPAGEVIWVLVTDIDCGRVRLGIEAAPGVKIDREEVAIEIALKESERQS